ncbi:hypothetical protein A2164_00195 [Candidatus Curtissbacteria bacterium RBG_13_35_7]|uniref:Phosphoribosyltransferase domain-containing protein n=1 Tax=Candidatus Curtissbacteria bacterium RBG_13_35_7 TaxID=1797705 RepID=A0A1F5G4A9_9BACT|nr:MAG: hypothetical protein A2164_00195 [Candidatus Curtissbacteria bacterium RBG_13_35_7]
MLNKLRNKINYHFFLLGEKQEKGPFEYLKLSMLTLYLKTKNFFLTSDNKAASISYIRFEYFKNKFLRKNFKYVTLKDLYDWTADWLKEIPLDIDIIVAVPRSGLLVGTLISVLRSKPLTTPDLFIKNRYWKSKHMEDQTIKKVFLVDDSTTTGKTIIKNFNLLEKTYPAIKIIKGALIATRDSKPILDTYHKIIPHPRIFEWNIMHGKRFRLAVDLDGVLCEECPPYVDSTESLYIKWISNAKPLRVPGFKIDAIVSNRLESYREVTEKWLEKNNIRYKKLYLWDIDSKFKRKNYAVNKIEHLIKIKPNLYWESDIKQAKLIFEKTKIPTLSIKDNILFS